MLNICIRIYSLNKHLRSSIAAEKLFIVSVERKMVSPICQK